MTILLIKLEVFLELAPEYKRALTAQFEMLKKSRLLKWIINWQGESGVEFNKIIQVIIPIGNSRGIPNRWNHYSK
jgi:hypothetical protein